MRSPLPLLLAGLLALAGCASSTGPGPSTDAGSVDTPEPDAGRGAPEDAGTTESDAGRTSDGGSEPRERPTIECEEPEDCELVRCECDGLTVEQQACFDGQCVDEDDCDYYCG